MRLLSLIIVSFIILTGSLFAQKNAVVNESSKLLKKGNSIERQHDIFKLLDQNNAETIDLLLGALKDPDRHVRYSAAWALGHSDVGVAQYPLIMGRILESLKDQDLWVRMQMMETLIEITFKQRLQKLEPDERVFKAFLSYAKDPDPYIRATATEGLVLWGKDPSAKKALLASFDDNVWLVRRHSIGRFRPKGYYGKVELQVLTEALKDEDYTVRLDAIYNLRSYDEPQIVDHLIERLYDPNGQVIFETIITLGLLKDPRAVKPLLDLLANDKVWEPDIRNAIEKITGKSSEEVLKGDQPESSKGSRRVAMVKQVDVHKQIGQFKNGNQSERTSAVLRLAWSDQPDGVETLIKALQDGDPLVRYAAADAIGANYLTQSRRTDRVLDGLFNAAADSDPFVRMKAIETLNKFTIEEHSALVLNFLSEALLKEQDPFNRWKIVTGLGMIRSTASNKDLSKIFVKFLNDPFFEVRRSAVSGINLRCLPDAMEPMIKMLKDPNPHVRESAARAFWSGDHPMISQALKEVSKRDPSEEVQNAARQSLESIENRRSSSRRESPPECPALTPSSSNS